MEETSLKSLFERDDQELAEKGMEMVLSILFLDIRRFTTHAEKLTLHQTFEFLNGLFRRLVPHIVSHHGVVDKFIGDAIMALFDGESSADNSVRAALAMQEELKLYNRERIERGEKDVQVGIGINTGLVMVGGVGDANRLALTVVGDDVNLASRIESLTKQYHARILISHRTHAALKEEHYSNREIDTMRVRGRARLVSVFELYGSDPPEIKQAKQDTNDLLFQGISLYKAGFYDEALERLKETLAIYPRDVVAIRYIKRCRHFIKNPPPDGMILEEAMSREEEKLDQTLTKRAARYQMNAKGDLDLKIFGTVGDSNQKKIVVTLLDISITGMRLKVFQPLEAGETYEVHYKFAHEGWDKMFSGPLVSFSQIIWNKRVDVTDPPEWEAGVEFLLMEPEYENSLKEGLDQLDMGFT